MTLRLMRNLKTKNRTRYHKKSLIAFSAKKTRKMPKLRRMKKMTSKARKTLRSKRNCDYNARSNNYYYFLFK